MLSERENELLCQVGPGTPMGDLFRRFWLPALLSSELPEPDCAPGRLRLLGEDLVAFRDTDGKVGVVDNFCPHRRASLFFGRNEECGLRCVYHGWKFDVNGDCVDMPSEPAESNFKDKVKITAYPAEDFGDCIWVYMGPPELKQELPQFEWARVPAEQRRVSRWIQDCNYMQALEGDLDSTHVSFLHKWMDPEQAMPWDPQQKERRRKAASGQALVYREGAPRFSVKETDFGMVYGARRPAGDDQYYWRLTNWLLPFYTMPPQPTTWFGHVWVPVDDEHMSCLSFSWDPNKPLDIPTGSASGNIAIERCQMRFADGFTIDTWRDKRQITNDYGIDRELQRTGNYTGIGPQRTQDVMVNETQGGVSDRTKEHLGTTDMAIIAARRKLIRLARELQEGIEPVAAQQGDLYHIRAIDVVSSESDITGVLEKHGDIGVAVH
jgi:phenylpropionate dioxygenase-like ring-hydroxylating dioxygenase large terminal subunit